MKKRTTVKDKIKMWSKSLRGIIGFSMTLVAALTLLLFVLMMVFFIRDTLISDLKTNAAQSVHLSYITLTNKHTDMIRKSSMVADELQHTSGSEEDLKNRMLSAYRLNDEIVSLSLFKKDGNMGKYAPAHYKTAGRPNLLETTWFQEPTSSYSFSFSPPHLQEWFDMPTKWVISLSKHIQIKEEPHC